MEWSCCMARKACKRIHTAHLRKLGGYGRAGRTNAILDLAPRCSQRIFLPLAVVNVDFKNLHAPIP